MRYYRLSPIITASTWQIRILVIIYSLPIYDGCSKHYQMYKSQRRRMNMRLKIIARSAGIESNFTTNTIRHSWATIVNLGISTALSERLPHSSIKKLKNIHFDYTLSNITVLYKGCAIYNK